MAGDQSWLGTIDGFGGRVPHALKASVAHSVRLAWLPLILNAACSSEQPNPAQQPTSDDVSAPTLEEDASEVTNNTSVAPGVPTDATVTNDTGTSSANDTAESSGNVEQAPLEDFCERRAAQICGFAKSCCAVIAEKECLDTAIRGCLKTVEESMGAQAEFDPQRAEACLIAEKEAWYSDSCEIQPTSANASVDALTICSHLGRGTVTLGGPCERDADCASLENGASVCAPRGDSAVCTESTLVATAGDCSAENAGCGARDYCESESNTCKPLGTDGETCSAHSDCLVGFCDPGLKVCPELTRETICTSLEVTL